MGFTVESHPQGLSSLHTQGLQSHPLQKHSGLSHLFVGIIINPFCLGTF